MGSDYSDEVRRLPKAAGCSLKRHGKGDHELWFSPRTGRTLPVDSKIKSRHTANAIMKQTGLPKAF